MLKVLFLHGLESEPGGAKPEALTKAGCEVLNPALPKESFEESIRIAQSCVDTEKPDLIVGSSRGGAVAMEIDAKGSRLILVAPAWKSYGVKPTVSSDTVILHSVNDDIVFLKDSMELKEATGATVTVCGEDHRMNDLAALRELVEAAE